MSRFVVRKPLLNIGAVSLALLLCLLDQPARAEYPDHSIRGIIPFATGGTSDILGRLFATYLGKELGQTVVPENKPGANGNLGMEIVAHSKPDGYTILFISSAATQNPALYKTMPYDPLKDLVPIAFVGETAPVIAVNAQKFPTQTLKDFVDYARKNPGKLNFAQADSGLNGNLFRLLNDVNIQLVSYNSSNDGTTAIMSGEADATITGPISIAAGLTSNRIRVLAVAGSKRLANMPDVPTTAEAGMPDFHPVGQYAVYVQGGTPADIVQKLNSALQKILSTQEVVDRLATFGWVPVKQTPAEALAAYRGDIARWKDVSSRSGLQTLD